eukprot:jgi/Chrzof1/8396/Cz03g09040.t1
MAGPPAASSSQPAAQDKQQSKTFTKEVPPHTSPQSSQPTTSTDTQQSNGSLSQLPPEDDEESCPICQFVEAGPCKEEHQAWGACRKAAQTNNKDFVEECKHHFKRFFECMMAHEEYYSPFLEMFGVPRPTGADSDDGAQPTESQTNNAPQDSSSSIASSTKQPSTSAT